MIVHLTKDDIRSRKYTLLNDPVYLLYHECLKSLCPEHTSMQPVEIYYSASNFCKAVIELPDIDEGLPELMEDIEEECKNDDDVIIMMVAAAMLKMMSFNISPVDSDDIILQIYGKYNDHELFFPLLIQPAEKEQSRWRKNKKINLLNYELQLIEQEGKGAESVKELLNSFLTASDKVNDDTIKENLLILNFVNINKHHSFDKEILQMYDKLGYKSAPNVEGDFVLQKTIMNAHDNFPKL